MLNKLFIPKLRSESGVKTPESENRNQQQHKHVSEQKQ